MVPLGIVVHELLHAAAWAIGGAGWTHVAFGAQPRRLMVHAHYAAPLPARVYRLGALLPGVAMGLFPAVVALLLGWAAVAGWAALFLGFACGDVLVVWALRGTPGSAMVLDHPTRPGCRVLEARRAA